MTDTLKVGWPCRANRDGECSFAECPQKKNYQDRCARDVAHEAAVGKEEYDEYFGG